MSEKKSSGGDFRYAVGDDEVRQAAISKSSLLNRSQRAGNLFRRTFG